MASVEAVMLGNWSRVFCLLPMTIPSHAEPASTSKQSRHAFISMSSQKFSGLIARLPDFESWQYDDDRRW